MDRVESDSEDKSAVSGDGDTLDLFVGDNDFGVRPARPSGPRTSRTATLTAAILPIVSNDLITIEPAAGTRLEAISSAILRARAAQKNQGYETVDLADKAFIAGLDLESLADHYFSGIPVFLTGHQVWHSAVLRHCMVEPLHSEKTGCLTKPLVEIVAWMVAAGHLDAALADIYRDEVDAVSAEFMGFRRPQEILVSWFETMRVKKLVCYRFDEFENQAWVFVNNRSLDEARGIEFDYWQNVMPAPRQAKSAPAPAEPQDDFPGDAGYVAPPEDQGGPPVFEQVPLEAYEADGGYDPDDGSPQEWDAQAP